MRATRIKAILLAANLLLPTWGSAENTSEDAEVYASRGVAKATKGDWNGAIADYDRALRLNPKFSPAYVNRGNAKDANGDSVGAIADYNRALHLNPKDVLAYYNRGLTKRKKGDLDSSIADFNRALELNPKLGEAYEGRGIAKVRKDDLDSAIADLNRALELNPKLAYAYLWRGVAKQGKGDVKRAIANFNRALKLKPGLAEAYGSRGSANFLARNWTDALQDYRRFCDLSKDEQEYPRLFIWLIRSRLGETETANRELAAHFKATSRGWTSKVAAYLLGNLSEANLLAAAKSADAKTARAQHCEALFYAGMKNLLGGNKPVVADYFKKCVATREKKAVLEYQFAQAELKALGQ